MEAIVPPELFSALITALVHEGPLKYTCTLVEVSLPETFTPQVTVQLAALAQRLPFRENVTTEYLKKGPLGVMLQPTGSSGPFAVTAWLINSIAIKKIDLNFSADMFIRFMNAMLCFLLSIMGAADYCCL
jgi:hypothetical protein